MKSLDHSNLSWVLMNSFSDIVHVKLKRFSETVV